MVELGSSATRKSVPLHEDELELGKPLQEDKLGKPLQEEEDDATIKILNEVNEGDIQTVIKEQSKSHQPDTENDPKQSKIQPDTENYPNLQEEGVNEGLDRLTNDADNFQPQHVISDKVDNQTFDKMSDPPTEDISKTNLINPSSFLIHKTDDLVTEATKKTSPKDELLYESMKGTKYALNDVHSSAIPGVADLNDGVVDFNSEDPENESEVDGIEEDEGVEGERSEEEAGEVDLMDKKRSSSGSVMESYKAEASKRMESYETEANKMAESYEAEPIKMVESFETEPNKMMGSYVTEVSKMVEEVRLGDQVTQEETVKLGSLGAVGSDSD